MMLFKKILIFISVASLVINLCVFYEPNTQISQEETIIEEIPVEETQKSVIDEQEIFYRCCNSGGVADILNTVDDEAINKIVEEIEIEEQFTNEYTDLINSLTEEDKELIYRITFREAGNQCEEGQRAVMEVILNRVLSDRFPNTVYEVLSAPGQFSTWKKRNEVSQENIEKMAQIFEVLCNNELILSTDYVYFDSVQHSYASNYIKIQGHWFGTRKSV